MLTPQAENWGDASPSSPTDRRPCCACVELSNPTFWQINFETLKSGGTRPPRPPPIDAHAVPV